MCRTDLRFRSAPDARPQTLPRRHAQLTALFMRIRARGDPMLDQATQSGSEKLQFDRVSTGTVSSAPGKVAVTCAACQTSIETTYFEVNGSILCRLCRTRAESAAETPRGIVPLMTAAIYGLGAGAVGAVIYYAVIAITHFEIGV